MRSVSNGLSLHVMCLISEAPGKEGPEGERVTSDLCVECSNEKALESRPEYRDLKEVRRL